ncbi:MAG: N-acetylmuramoyl-L-alanine amidase [Candidatus Margulisiibacteriota bacterium]
MNKKNITAVFLALILAGSALAKVEIKLIQGNRDRGFDYLDIYTSDNVKATGLLLENQLLIDFPDTEIAKDITISKKYLEKSKRIKDVRIEQLDTKTTRVIIDLKNEIDYDIVNVFGRNKNVIEISDRVGQAARIMAAWEKANLQKKGEELKPYKYAEGKGQALRGKVIVLDPGHGGKDPGSFSLNGVPEKHLTLQLARKIASLLSDSGATVYLTRNNDRTCSIKDIVKFTNSKNADIFISIHYNYYYQRDISGTETYYYNRQSRGLALEIHRSLVQGIKRKDRGLRQAMFYTIHHTEMPAVLLEPLYISNQKESELAGSAKFQAEMAQDILRGVKAYFRSNSS